MSRIRKGLLLAVVLALMLAAVPLVMAQDEPPPQPPQQPPQPPPDTNVNVDVNIPWGTILLVGVAVLVLLSLVGLASRSDTSTHTIERVEEHHHDNP